MHYRILDNVVEQVIQNMEDSLQLARRSILEVTYLLRGPATLAPVRVASVVVGTNEGRQVVVPLLPPGKYPYYGPDPKKSGDFELYSPQMSNELAHKHGELVLVLYRLETLQGLPGHNIQMHSAVIDNLGGDFIVYPDRYAPSGYVYAQCLTPGYQLF